MHKFPGRSGRMVPCGALDVAGRGPVGGSVWCSCPK
jgi:hypothetical protein